MVRLGRLALWFGSLIIALLASGCSDEDRPQPGQKPSRPTGAGGSGVVMPPPVGGAGGSGGSGPGCLAVRSAEPVPARIDVISDTVVPRDRTMLVGDLFFLFKSTCGACHVGTNQGGFQVDNRSFSVLVDEKVLELILSDDPKKVMPPPPTGVPAKDRQPGDPVLQLASLLQTWIAAGRPNDVFVIPGVDPGGDTSPYLLSEKVGMGMTNIGDCVPLQSVIATNATRPRELDTFFAGLEKTPPGVGTQLQRIGLPEHLRETDLYTLDTETLAHDGVIAYAPAYPLWSDNARKIRHVRVPKGQSIRFDKDKQSFEIPPNTRFYKTFLKRLIDKDGSERYRKVETRLIISRPDRQLGDGTFEQTALFGTYVWNDDETDAVLLTDPLRSGEPFGDRLLTLVADEPKAQEIRDSQPRDLAKALQTAGAIRHYAIPGKDRCIQCHMGSPGQAFVLGFTPLQIRRRPLGEGGVIEPTGPDELNQLERLIEYGVITGMGSPDDILPLEGRPDEKGKAVVIREDGKEEHWASPQGSRLPRNDYELVAQGYMIGNCAHCHNPNGFPSVTAPVLANLLNFLPGPEGGIFQFRLDQTSPRILRGLDNDVAIPYITPSLVDFPSKSENRMWDPAGSRTPSQPAPWYVFAPWRSLIYRNVDTPFPYGQDSALFPHMPMNVPGFDCRAPRILGDWMVSIPSARIKRDMPELGVPAAPQFPNVVDTKDFDVTPQPYTEVKPGEDGYDQAKEAAAARLRRFHENEREAVLPPGQIDLVVSVTGYARYSYCPDTRDIVDPDVTGVDREHLSPANLVRVERNGKLVDTPSDGFSPIEAKDAQAGDVAVMPNVFVPSRPHWVVTDPTEPAAGWLPKRSDWSKILVDHGSSGADRIIVETLNPSNPAKKGVTITAATREFAAEELALGLWQQKDGCDFSKVPKVSSLNPPPEWVVRTEASPDAPLYMQTPGEAVYGLICINCHGVRADSRGRQADTLLIMTGGDARVANFRAGLFGPADKPGANIAAVFGQAAEKTPAVTAEDWAARYLAWMALGGTSKLIPTPILKVVGGTRVLGVMRRFSGVPASANMLSSAQNLCAGLTGASGYPAEGHLGAEIHGPLTRQFMEEARERAPLVFENGDADLWSKVCTLENPQPVRVLYAYGDDAGSFSFTSTYLPGELYPADRPIGSGAHVLAKAGARAAPGARGVGRGVAQPWCMAKPENHTNVKGEAAAAVLIPNTRFDGQPLPICPDEAYPADSNPKFYGMSNDELDRWADRGAINAGSQVFLYVKAIANGFQPKPTYDRCDLLTAAK